jgi:hypothetical protein
MLRNEIKRVLNEANRYTDLKQNAENFTRFGPVGSDATGSAGEVSEEGEIIFYGRFDQSQFDNAKFG